jgi:Fic family protein
MRRNEFSKCDQYACRIAALRPFPKETLKSLREYYRVGLTYTSNALEGNSLTESETKIVIEDGLTISGKPLRDVYEATGHAKAYDFIYELLKKRHVLESDVLKIHKLFQCRKVALCQSFHFRFPQDIAGSRKGSGAHGGIFEMDG